MKRIPDDWESDSDDLELDEDTPDDDYRPLDFNDFSFYDGRLAPDPLEEILDQLEEEESEGL